MTESRFISTVVHILNIHKSLLFIFYFDLISIKILLWELDISLAVTEHFRVSCIRLIYLLHYSNRCLKKITRVWGGRVWKSERNPKISQQYESGLVFKPGNLRADGIFVNCVRHLAFTGKWS